MSTGGRILTDGKPLADFRLGDYSIGLEWFDAVDGEPGHYALHLRRVAQWQTAYLIEGLQTPEGTLAALEELAKNLDKVPFRQAPPHAVVLVLLQDLVRVANKRWRYPEERYEALLEVVDEVRNALGEK